MILSVGEILADIVGAEKDFKINLGGAPFNMAVNAKNNGAKVGFIGAIGNDVVGKILLAQANKYNLDCLNLQKLSCNTTLAFVTLDKGERNFSFFRDNTADYKIDFKKIDLSIFKDLSILHIGSLMLNKKVGQKAVKNLIKQAKKLNIKVSFDVNLRDIFKDESDIITALNTLARKDVLYVVSLGEKGSLCFYNDRAYSVPTTKVNPVDTTGAGDAFYGTFIAEIENKEYTEQVLVSALKKANLVGAETTLFYGALK